MPNKTFIVNIFTKDGLRIATIDIIKLLEITNAEHIYRIGNRSIIIEQENKQWYKVKGIGIQKYTGHYGRVIDPIYGQQIGTTDIKYMPYKLFNTKLESLPPNSIIINQAYQDFIGEPIGGINLKEKNSEQIYKRIAFHGSTPKHICAFKPFKWLSVPIPNYNTTVYFMVYEPTDTKHYPTIKTAIRNLNDKQKIKQLLLNAADTLAYVLYTFYKSKIIIPKDKDVLNDIAANGKYIDIADLYIGENQLEFFMSLYLFFKELLFIHTNLYRDKKFLRKFLKPFLEKFKVTPKKGFYSIDDDILLGNMVAALLKVPLPKPKELNRYLKEKVGADNVVAKNKAMLQAYYLLETYDKLGKSLFEVFYKTEKR